MININELQEALQIHGYSQVTQDELKKIIDNVDYAGNGKINYSEFLVATIEIKNVLTYDIMWALFKYFDTDNSGIITPENLKEAFGKTGKALTDREIQIILKKHAIQRKNGISFDEFQ